MAASYHRHDISDEAWALIEPHTIGNKGTWGGNADLRHYIPVLARRSRCFARTLETLQAVVEVFVGAYNRFGAAKHAYRQRRPTGGFPFALVDFL